MPRRALAIALQPQTRAELKRLARVPSTPQGLALRARLVLAAARGSSNQEIAAAFHITANTVSKWRTRFALFGLAGLTDYAHPGRPRKHGPHVWQRLHSLLRWPPPDGRERWTVRGLARELGLPPSTVQEMLLRAGFKNRRRPAERPPRC
jgi:transposase